MVERGDAMGDIVVGVDGSESSAEALRWATREADARAAQVVAVLAWGLFDQYHADGVPRFDPAYDETAADAALAAYIDRALGAERPGDVVRRPVCDRPAPGLLAAAAGADLLVVGARGLGGFRGLLLGSVSQHCLHHAPGPIAVVRGQPGGDGRVVVGVDGSETSEAALRWAMADAAARGWRVEAVHAWEMAIPYGPATAYDVPAVEAAARRMVDRMVGAVAGDKHPGAPVTATVVANGPVSGLLGVAEGADLIVVGRRGLGGFGRLLLGSVSDHVVRHASTTVVVVPGDPAG